MTFVRKHSNLMKMSSWRTYPTRLPALLGGVMHGCQGELPTEDPGLELEEVRSLPPSFMGLSPARPGRMPTLPACLPVGFGGLGTRTGGHGIAGDAQLVPNAGAFQGTAGHGRSSRQAEGPQDTHTLEHTLQLTLTHGHSLTSALWPSEADTQGQICRSHLPSAPKHAPAPCVSLHVMSLGVSFLFPRQEWPSPRDAHPGLHQARCGVSGQQSARPGASQAAVGSPEPRCGRVHSISCWFPRPRTAGEVKPRRPREPAPGEGQHPACRMGPRLCGERPAKPHCS